MPWLPQAHADGNAGAPIEVDRTRCSGILLGAVAGHSAERRHEPTSEDSMRQLRTIAQFSALSFVALAAVACGESKPAATQAAGAGTPAPPQVAVAGDELASPTADAPGGKQYTVVAETVTLKNGEKKVVAMRIEPGKGLKFNADFPTKFTVTAAPFARSERDKLSAKDGDIKVDGKAGVISVPVVATAAGRGNLSLAGRFSVCNDEQCFVLSETIQLAVAVQ